MQDNCMDDKEFIQIVEKSVTMAYAAKQIGMAYTSFKRQAIKLGCFNPNPGAKGTHKKGGAKIPVYSM